jgi:hypothetical protein
MSSNKDMGNPPPLFSISSSSSSTVPFLDGGPDKVAPSGAGRLVDIAPGNAGGGSSVEAAVVGTALVRARRADRDNISFPVIAISP